MSYEWNEQQNHFSSPSQYWWNHLGHRSHCTHSTISPGLLTTSSIMQGRALHPLKLSQKIISKSQKSLKIMLKSPPKNLKNLKNLFFKSSESRKKILFKFQKKSQKYKKKDLNLFLKHI